MKKRKRIAIDARELTRRNLGSLGYVLLEVLKYLSDYDVILYSDIEVLERYVPKNAKVISRGKKYTGGIDLYKFQYWMKQKMKEDKIDVSFQINHFSVFPTRGIKQIVVVHDLYPLENIETKSLKDKLIYWVALSGTMLFADRIFTVSEFSKKRLEHFFWKTRKIAVNYNGIHEPLYIERLDSYKCVSEPFFLMLGRVTYWKGTLRMVQLYDKYLSDCGYKLVIAGQAESEETKRDLQEYIDKNPNIVWLDYVTDETKEWLLQNCALLIYASRYDGFGLPPLEAAIRKKKVIMNDIEILREVSKNLGHYVDFYSNDRDAVEAILSEISGENEAQIRAMHEVAKSYTWQRYGEAILREIES